jgi:hypothetical protein
LPQATSFFVGFSFGLTFFPEVPIAGCIGVGIVEALPPGWVCIGPVVELLGIVHNSAESVWFDRKTLP